MRYTLPDRLRLTKKNNFDQVFAKRQRVSTKYFSFYYCSNDVGYPRMGIGVSKRNIKKASKRKKLIEIFSLHLEEYLSGFQPSLEHAQEANKLISELKRQFDKLRDENPQSGTGRAQCETKGRCCFALSVSGIHLHIARAHAASPIFTVHQLYFIL